MGGVGAKDRRRVQRQSRPDLDATEASSTRRTTSRHASRSTAPAAAAAIPVPTPAKKVSKKPKHLRRKLEAASSAAAEGLVSQSNNSTNNDYEADERSALLQQLEKWQSAKASYLERTRSRTERRRPKAAKKARKEEDVDNVGTKGSFVRGSYGTNASKAAVRGGEIVRDGARVARIHPSHRSRPNGAAKPHDGEGAGTHGVQSPKRYDVSTKDPLRGGEASPIRRRGVVGPRKTAVELDRVDSEDDDPDDDGSTAPKRQRGQRRRRGKKIAEVHPSHEEESTAGKEPEVDGPEATRSGTDKSTQGNMEESPSILDLDETISSTDNNKKTKRKYDDDSRDRYCVGRKPVTDFRVGQSYPGKVVYVKPFGVFVDIGCHSDAFCHVSRLADDFVDDPATAFRPGDAMTSARVVEIDRKRKRITVSFQSEAKMEDERQSVEARQERMKKRPRKEIFEPRSRTRSLENVEAPRDPPAVEPAGGAVSRKNPEPTSASTSRSTSERASSTSPPPTTDSSLTPQQQLKRARKLERRAARRAAENDHVTP